MTTPEGSKHPFFLSEENIYVELTDSPLDILSTLSKVKSPKAGANILFSGTTRDSFASKSVLHLHYSAYAPLALRTMLSIASSIKIKYDLTAIAMIHRLGTVPICEESILIAVSAPHREAAWKAGEEALEECKSKVEIWKMEEFEEGGVWRSNSEKTAFLG